MEELKAEIVQSIQQEATLVIRKRLETIANERITAASLGNIQ
jgi:hypothetical protein